MGIEETPLSHTDAATGVAFTADGSSMITVGRDGAAVVCDLATEQETVVIRPQAGGIVAFAVAPAGDAIALATEKGWSSAWSIVPGHTAPIRDLAVDSFGRHVATAGLDGTVRLWTMGGRRVGLYTDHIGNVWDVDFSPDGELLASVSSDGVAFGVAFSVRAWSARESLLSRSRRSVAASSTSS
jgi:WD40 repeat protein